MFFFFHLVFLYSLPRDALVSAVSASQKFHQTNADMLGLQLKLSSCPEGLGLPWVPEVSMSLQKEKRRQRKYTLLYFSLFTGFLVGGQHVLANKFCPVLLLS